MGKGVVGYHREDGDLGLLLGGGEYCWLYEGGDLFLGGWLYPG